MRRRSPLLLLAGCTVVGLVAWMNGDEPRARPAAAMEGGAIDPVEISKFQNLATDTGASIAKAAPPATIDSIDLDKITRDGDHYIAPLADGRTATLTLDPDLQELAEKLLNESRAPKGAIVVMSTDGKLLALAGRKTEEPKGSTKGTFDWRLATEVWAPAASIFKLVTATALVKAGVDPDDKVCFHGGLRSVLEHNLKDDKRDNRCENLSYGVAHSQNAIVGKLAFQKLTQKTLVEEATALGWTSTLDSFKGTFGELSLPEAQDVEFARAAAGFQGAKLSVLGGALLAATFAADGEQPMPQIIASIDGKPVELQPAHRAITSEQAQAVAKMMAGTCDSGSASKTFQRRKKVSVAGKTGTLATSTPFFMEHSWFVGFAPADKPSLVISVLLGNPESWHLKGHEAAKRLIDKALARPKSAAVRGKDRSAG